MATHFPREMITSDNHSPIVNILTWILLVSVVLSVGAKLAIKTTACHSFDTDDAVLTAAMVILHECRSLLVLNDWSSHQVLSAAQSVARSIQTYNGVGRHSESLKTSQVTSYEKVCFFNLQGLRQWFDGITGWLFCGCTIYHQSSGLQNLDSRATLANYTVSHRQKVDCEPWRLHRFVDLSQLSRSHIPMQTPRSMDDSGPTLFRQGNDEKSPE